MSVDVFALSVLLPRRGNQGLTYHNMLCALDFCR